MSNSELPDVGRLIEADLGDLQRSRRRHFLPALMLAVGVATAMLLATGTRSDLLAQPWWQLLSQGLAWVLCLLVLPSVGLGLWFPSRPVRIGLAVAAVLAGIGASMHLPDHADLLDHGPGAIDMCLYVTMALSVMFLGIGAISGAFAQRRAASSVWWIAGGIALLSLNTVTWHCPNIDPGHLLTNHLGSAVLAVLLATAVGVVVRRRQRADL